MPGRVILDTAHPRERCDACGVGLGTVLAVRTPAEGRIYHPICWEPPVRPPRADVEQLWGDCYELPAAVARGAVGALQAAAYLLRRGLLRGSRGSVRLLAADCRCPDWCRYGEQPWTATGHRLIVPVYDHAGRLALVRGWRWEGGDAPKRLAAAGCSVRGLVMAGRRGRRLLQGRMPEWYYPGRVVIVEGEPDTLAAARWPDWCVLGITSGSWCDELAGRVPAGAVVVVRTHADDAGDRYAELITETLTGRCSVTRVRTGCDVAALLRAGELGDSPLDTAM